MKKEFMFNKKLSNDTKKDYKTLIKEDVCGLNQIDVNSTYGIFNREDDEMMAKEKNEKIKDEYMYEFRCNKFGIMESALLAECKFKGYGTIWKTAKRTDSFDKLYSLYKDFDSRH